MEFVRVLDPIHYDDRDDQKRFTRMAFRPSKGGISVFNKKCAIDTSGSVCGHIKTFYGQLTGIPELFWIIDISWFQENLPEGQQNPVFTPTKASDPCHHDITGLPKNGKKSGAMLQKAWSEAAEAFFECNGDSSTQLNRSSLSQYKSRRIASKSS